ncbi:MAG: DNA polymerase III subunit delta [Chitinophagaceae bacterium]|nr:DNA polymerase III subunit delta [Chitinophagaceae bacterium]
MNGKKAFKPVYWLEGEEEYYIDQLINYAEHKILTSAEAEFNLTIFYGRDADWPAIINACRRYPMFAERQLVILKEAQHLKDIDKLEGYFHSPLTSTVFIISYKGKTIDKRTKTYKLLKSNAEIFTSEKIRDYKLAGWIADFVKNSGYTINNKSVLLLAEHLGNDLSRIANEVEKLSLNLKGAKEINEDHIEQYIGISKEYNVFELQAAIAKKDMAKAIIIIQYFDGNPKAGPIQMILPALYSSFSKILSVYGLADKSEPALRSIFFNNPEAVKNALQTMKLYGMEGLEKLILLLHHYKLKSIGVASTSTTSNASLLKEMVVKMMM